MARRLPLVLMSVLVFLVSVSAATAAPSDPLGFRFSSATYTVSESAGSALVTVQRLNTVGTAEVRYLTLAGSAVRGDDYTPVKSMLSFAPGQASASFRVPIVDHGMPGLPRTVKLALFGPWPIGFAAPTNAVLTILEDDAAPAVVSGPLNPLGLPASPPAGQPLLGANAFVDPTSLAAMAARHWSSSHPRAAGMLEQIARQPGVQRYGRWNGAKVGLPVSQFLERAAIRQPGSVPELSTYWLVHGNCHKCADSPARAAEYHRWIESLASGIGSYRAIVFLEIDSLITVGSLSHHGLEVRLHELHDALDILSKLPHVAVYLDAGAADALGARHVARLLREAGISEIEGFFLNATHFDWTRHEIAYGEKVSRLTGGQHFVVNTADNGRGPLVPRDRVHHGNEVLCNPPGRGLGPLPTFDTGFPRVDAFAWIAYPGRSGGPCRPGAPRTGFFWPAWAVSLVKHANYAVH